MAIVSDSHRFIYVSGGRCATHSLYPALLAIPKLQYIEPAKIKPGEYRKFYHHMPARLIKERVGSKRWDRYFKFTFVRNPYDWVVSSFFHCVQVGHFRRPTGGVMTIENFKQIAGYYMTAPGRRHLNIPIRTQLDFIADKSGKIMVDFVGRVEDLNCGWEYICSKIGVVPYKLEHNNQSTDRPYQAHYTPASRQYVEKLWGRDIQAFGYKFGE